MQESSDVAHLPLLFFEMKKQEFWERGGSPCFGKIGSLGKEANACYKSSLVCVFVFPKRQRVLVVLSSEFDLI